MEATPTTTMTEVIEGRWMDFQHFLDNCNGNDRRATMDAIKAGFIPPHWTGILHCNNCGFMACPEEQHGQKLLNCAWCKTIVGGLYENIRKENEEWERKIKRLETLGRSLRSKTIRVSELSTPR